MNNFEIGKQRFIEGLQQLQSSNFLEAINLFRQSLDAVPGRTSTLVNLSAALIKAGLPNEAKETLLQLYKIDANIADLWLNFGLISKDNGDLEEASDHFNRALQIDPKMTGAWLNKAFTLQELHKYESALHTLNQLIAIDDKSVAAFNCKGQVLANLKRYEESVLAYEKALSLDPYFKFIKGSLQHAKMHICDWKNFDKNLNAITQDIKKNLPATSPFPILSLIDDPEIHKITAEIYTDLEHPQNIPSAPFKKSNTKSKIRLGYFSADFHQHATAYLMAEFFELHDKSRFEVIAFSFGPKTQDQMQERLYASFDKFIYVQKNSDAEIANLARSLEIDIAIDLKGFTTDYRANIFAQRAAPIQINYLGYPGTMGAKYIDYLIGDCIITPPSHAMRYTEQLALLPNCYQANDRSRLIPQWTPPRESMGISENQFVFCCFNNNYKITPVTFTSWMRLLKKVPDSVIWLLEDNPYASKNLREEAEKNGVDPNRLIFASRLSLPDHLARHQCADLFLDTFPYNAHTTASDALWAGLPVLTMSGQSFASRVAASLLSAIGLPELITHSIEEYEALAIHLANNPNKLKEIKNKLIANRLTTPLFDSKSFTKDIESIYLKMYERYINGLEPAFISINEERK